MTWTSEPCATCGGDASKGGVIPGPGGFSDPASQVFCREHYPQGEPNMVKGKKGRKPKGKASTNGAAGPHAPVERRKFKDKLPCRIDDDAVALKAREIAKVVHARELVRTDRREANAEFREQLTAYDARLQELATSIDMHTETRSVDCVERLTAQNEIETVRLDTGEIVSTRAAEADDLQESLPGTEDDGEDDEEFSEGPNPKPSRRHAAADGATAP